MEIESELQFQNINILWYRKFFLKWQHTKTNVIFRPNYFDVCYYFAIYNDHHIHLIFLVLSSPGARDWVQVMHMKDKCFRSKLFTLCSRFFTHLVNGKSPWIIWEHGRGKWKWEERRRKAEYFSSLSLDSSGIIILYTV